MKDFFWLLFTVSLFFNKELPQYMEKIYLSIFLKIFWKKNQVKNLGFFGKNENF